MTLSRRLYCGSITKYLSSPSRITNGIFSVLITQGDEQMTLAVIDPGRTFFTV